VCPVGFQSAPQVYQVRRKVSQQLFQLLDMPLDELIQLWSLGNMKISEMNVHANTSRG
jgi:hypothetical protein